MKHIFTSICITIAFTELSLAERPEGKLLASASVTYALDKQGNKQTGILSLIMTEGKKTDLGLGDVNQGKFTLHLEMREGKEITASLNKLFAPIIGSDPMVFDAGYFPLVISDHNRDGISEFNIGQPGNSWGGHYMLFTFSEDGSGKIETMTVSKEKEFNYLHPQSSRPSTTELRQTKEGFCHLFTERGGAQDREVDIHFHWDKKSRSFVEAKRVPR